MPLLKNGIAFGLGITLWLIPFLYYIGGWDHFLHIFAEAMDPKTTLTENLAVFTGTTVWMLGIPGILALFKGRRRDLRDRNETMGVLFLLIIIPALFFAFRYVAKGYELLFLAPVVLLEARALQNLRTSFIAIAIGGNLMTFFFMPFIAPSMRWVLNHRNRTGEERLASALLRHTSIFAPTLAHIRASDAAIAEAHRLLAAIPKHNTVMVDYSAAFWAFPRMLQYDFPELTFLTPIVNDSLIVQRFSAAEIYDTIPWPELSRLPLVYYLTDSNLITNIGAPPGMPIRREGRLTLYGIAEDSIPAVHEYIDRYFVRSE